MNASFEAALKLIDMKAYEDAEVNLRTAIEEEYANNNESTAIEYTCVLGELLANIGQPGRARTEFNKVVEYCDKTQSLPKQRDIALTFLAAFDGKAAPQPMAGKPAQNKAFITKQMRTRGKK